MSEKLDILIQKMGSDPELQKAITEYVDYWNAINPDDFAEEEFAWPSEYQAAIDEIRATEPPAIYFFEFTTEAGETRAIIF